MKLKIQVTEEDIINGKQESQTSCPIARAIKRTFVGQHVSVDTEAIEIGDFVFDTPKRARTFMNQFDKGNMYRRPFTILLDNNN